MGSGGGGGGSSFTASCKLFDYDGYYFDTWWLFADCAYADYNKAHNKRTALVCHHTYQTPANIVMPNVDDANILVAIKPPPVDNVVYSIMPYSTICNTSYYSQGIFQVYTNACIGNCDIPAALYTHSPYSYAIQNGNINRGISLNDDQGRRVAYDSLANVGNIKCIYHFDPFCTYGSLETCFYGIIDTDDYLANFVHCNTYTGDTFVMTMNLCCDWLVYSGTTIYPDIVSAYTKQNHCVSVNTKQIFLDAIYICIYHRSDDAVCAYIGTTLGIFCALSYQIVDTIGGGVAYHPYTAHFGRSMTCSGIKSLKRASSSLRSIMIL